MKLFTVAALSDNRWEMRSPFEGTARRFASGPQAEAAARRAAGALAEEGFRVGVRIADRHGAPLAILRYDPGCAAPVARFAQPLTS